MIMFKRMEIELYVFGQLGPFPFLAIMSNIRGPDWVS